MVITASGSVGIGTLSPADLLHVAGDMRVGVFNNADGCVKRGDGVRDVAHIGGAGAHRVVALSG